MWYESIVEIKVKRTVDANALVPGSAGVLDCNPSNLQTSNKVAAHRSLYFLAALSPQQPWPSRAVSEIEITLGFRKWRRHRESLAVAMFVLIELAKNRHFTNYLADSLF